MVKMHREKERAQAVGGAADRGRSSLLGSLLSRSLTWDSIPGCRDHDLS